MEKREDWLKGNEESIWRRVFDASSILESIPDRLQQLTSANGNRPQTGSIASQELCACDNRTVLQDAFDRGTLNLIHVSSDHMSGLKRTLSPSPRVLSAVPWTCARGVLESSSNSIWLLDNKIDPLERITRSLNLRLQEQDIQKRLVRKQEVYTRKDNTTLVMGETTSQIEARIRYFREVARKVGIAEKQDKRDRFIGFGSGTVPISARIASTHKADLDYAMLSSAAHGNVFATLSLTTEIVGGIRDRVSVVPNLNPLSVLYLVFLASEWFSRAAWTYFGLFGWDLCKLRSVLEEEYDKADIDHDYRFWRIKV